MEYMVTTNKNELNLTENKYYEICPGIFNKLFWGENSLFISDDLLRIVEDIISKSNDKFFSFNDFTYFNVEQTNKLENKIPIRINEIKNNKKIFDANKEYTMEYLNKKVDENRYEIIEMLNKLLSWIKINKENGISIVNKKWDFKILTINDLHEDHGPYLEFLPGEFENKCMNDNSIFIKDCEVDIVNDLLCKFNEEYIKYGYEYFYDENLLDKLLNELEKRANQIKLNGYVVKGKNNKKYYNRINRYMELYKNEIIEMLDNFIEWIKMNKSNGITIIGI